MIISFEGIDGSGKSTQAGLLAESLTHLGISVRVLREPGGTSISEKIRSILLDPTFTIDPFAEMLLYSAARAQLVREELTGPEAESGVTICDRFFDSTIAYQGGGRGIAEMEWLDQFQRRVTGGLVPDRTYLIRVSLQTALVRQEGRTADRMEQSDAAFFERVVKAYDRIAEKSRDRVKIIDGEGMPDQIAEMILDDLLSWHKFSAWKR